VGTSVPLVRRHGKYEAAEPAGARCPRASRRDAGATWLFVAQTCPMMN